MTRKIADAHTHIYPEKIADKATESVGEFYHLHMDSLGTSAVLTESGKEYGITNYLVCSVATTPKQVESINNFLYEETKKHPEFVPLAAMHMDYEDYNKELLRIKSLGFKGVKFHPDFQKFYIDDEKMLSIYEECLKLDLPILFHMGDERYEYSKPARLCRILRKYPDLKCIAAHFGGYQDWKLGYEEYPKLFSEGCGKNLYFDTSSSLAFLDPRTAADMINKYGEDRFMFGSDFPMWEYKEELERFEKLDLTENQREKILFGNFEKLFIKGE